MSGHFEPDKGPRCIEARLSLPGSAIGSGPELAARMFAKRCRVGLSCDLRMSCPRAALTRALCLGMDATYELPSIVQALLAFARGFGYLHVSFWICHSPAASA